MEESPSYNLSRNEMLKSRKLIEKLFTTGGTFLVFPIKVVYMFVDEPMDFPLKIGVSASSKKFKKAVDRNRIKRLVKEYYRMNKHPLHNFLNVDGKQLVVFFMYIDKGLPEHALLKRKMPLIIDKLITTLSEATNQNI